MVIRGPAKLEFRSLSPSSSSSSSSPSSSALFLFYDTCRQRCWNAQKINNKRDELAMRGGKPRVMRTPDRVKCLLASRGFGIHYFS